MSPKREKWTNKIGVILAVAGGAVGLGNFLRFPGQVCQNGGGAFMIPYFISFILLGIPLCWIEWTMGRYGGQHSHGSLPGIFDVVVKRPWAKYLGVLGLFVPLVIFFYYTYIESWCLSYSFFSLTGKYSQINDPNEMRGFLSAFQGLSPNKHFANLGVAYAFFIVTFVINMIIIYKGLAKGIEFICKLAMPVLIFGGVFMVIRVFTFGTPNPQMPELNINNALGFMWNPDFSALKNPKVWLAASGQIFFTLSVGLGAIMTYASYLRKKDDVVLSSISAASMNELFEVVIGGSIIIPAAYMFFGPEQTQAFGKSIFDLGFVTMPMIMNKINFGEFFGFFWFFILFLGGITSSISLMQPVISFLEDEFGWSRHKSAISLGILCFFVSHASILGLGYGVLDEFDFWGGVLAITLCAFCEVLIFVFYVGINKGWKEFHKGADIKIPNFFKYVFYITPFYLGTIIAWWGVFEWIPWILKPFGYDLQLSFCKDFPFVSHSISTATINYPVIITRCGLLALILILLGLIFWAWRLKAKKTEIA